MLCPHCTMFVVAYGDAYCAGCGNSLGSHPAGQGADGPGRPLQPPSLACVALQENESNLLTAQTVRLDGQIRRRQIPTLAETIERHPCAGGLSWGVVVFSGSFRRWHGADFLVRAASRVLQKLEERNILFLFLGSGPDLGEVRREVSRLGIGSQVHLTGAVPYDQMPLHLARCHVGVAPYQPSRHGQLQLGFYWSPLKIFEYMACGLPCITLDIDPLREIIRPGREGLLIQEGDEQGLADAIVELVTSPERAAEMGRAARQRIVSHYSWQVHCEKLEEVLRGLIPK